jgi:hypothetical protein
MIDSIRPKEMDVAALVSPSETICEQVDRLMRAHGNSWPPLHSAPTSAAIARLIARVEGLEQAIHAIALQLQTLVDERDR